MSHNCPVPCIKVSLLTANALLSAIGTLLFGIGAYMFSHNDLDHYTVIGIAHWIWNIRMALLVCGGVILLVAVPGFVGVCRIRNAATAKGVVILYAVLVALLLVATLAIVTVTLVYYTSISYKAANMASYNILKHYGANDSSGLLINSLTEAVDTVQMEHRCCGWLGGGMPNVFVDTAWYTRTSAQQEGRLFPDSCCSVLDDLDKLEECTKASDEHFARSMGYMHTEDCIDQFVENNLSAFKIAVAIALVAVLLQICCIVLAAVYIKNLRAYASSQHI